MTFSTPNKCSCTPFLSFLGRSMHQPTFIQTIHCFSGKPSFWFLDVHLMVIVVSDSRKNTIIPNSNLLAILVPDVNSRDLLSFSSLGPHIHATSPKKIYIYYKSAFYGELTSWTYIANGFTSQGSIGVFELCYIFVHS